ncbi:hypothetical protein GC170_10475 [bacterium]|nr:hypothetical protein [bacterium]
MPDRDTEELVEIFRHLWTRISHQARRDPDMAGLIRQLAMSLLRNAEVSGPPGGIAPSYPQRVKEPYGGAYGARGYGSGMPVHEPRYGEFEGEYYRPAATESHGWGGPEAGMVAPEPPRRIFGPDTIDLNLISERARLKAEGVRWAWTRERRIHAGADFMREIQPNDQSLVHRAKALSNCYMWMNDPFGPRLTDQRQMETLAGCFETLAEAVSLVKEVMPDRHKQPDLVKQALTYMAQSQSALRMIVRQVYDRDDQDQMESYQWLRRITQVERIYLSRYMRLDDPADPNDWVMIHEAVTRIEQQLDDTRRTSTEIKKQIRKLGYETSQIAHLPADLALPRWEIVFTTIEDLLDMEVPPSHPDMINPLLHIAPSIPDEVEVPDSCSTVWNHVVSVLEEKKQTEESTKALRSRMEPGLRSVTQSLKTRATDLPETPEIDSTTLIKDRLRGRSIVLVSGEVREPARRALQKELELKELIWFSLSGPEDMMDLKAEISSPDVVLVMVSPKAAEKAREELIQVCESTGKPLVRLSIGYGPSTVLSAIVNQAAERLTGGSQAAARGGSLTSVAPGRSSVASRRAPSTSAFGQGFDEEEDD